MKTLGVLLLLVACVSSGFAHEEKVHKKKDPAIHAIWISHNKKTSYLKLDDGTYIEYFTSEKEKFNRYKALVVTKGGYTILKPLNDKYDFYLAIGKSKVLYQEETFKNIEKHGKVESSGYWIKLDKASHSKSNSKSKHSKPKHSKSKHSKSKHSKSKHSDSDSHSKESKKCSKSQCHEDPCKDKCSTNKTLKCVRDCHECTAKWTYKKKDVTCQVADNNEQVKWISTTPGLRFERVDTKQWKKVETGQADVFYDRLSSIIDTNGYLSIRLQQVGGTNTVALSSGSRSSCTAAGVCTSGVGYWADANSNILPSPKADSHAQVKWTSSDNINEYIQIAADTWILYVSKVFSKVYTRVTTSTYDKDGYLELVLQEGVTPNYVKLIQGNSFSGITPTNIVTPIKDGYWENKFGNPISRPKDGKHNIVRWQEVDDTFEFIKISQDKTGDIWIKYVNGDFYARYQRLSSSKDKHLKKGEYPTLNLKDVNNEDYVRLTEGKAYQGTHVNNVKTDLAHGFWADKYGNFVSHPDNSNSKSKSKSHHSKSKSHHSKSNSHSKSHSKSKESKKCHDCHNTDPCKKAKCHANKHAKCRNDCHKCRATWYYDHKKVSCDKKVHKKESHSSGSDSKSSHHH